jgi:branched-chain amino acid transport system substrate-binding protein
VPSRLLASAVAVLAVGATAIGCGSDDSQSASTGGGDSKPFVFLCMSDTTGPAKVYGDQQKLSCNAAVDHVNANGGVNGHQVKLTHVSTNGDPATGVAALQKFISQNGKPDLVWPGEGSSTVAAVLPSIKQQGLLSFSGSDAGGLLRDNDYPFSFAAQATPEFPTQAAAKWFSENGIKKVGILEADIDYNKGETPFMEKALDAAGIQHTVVGFKREALDLTPQMDKLKSSGVDGIYFEGLGPTVGFSLDAREKLAWDVPWVGDLSASSLDLTTLVSSPSELKNTKLVVFRPNPASQAQLPGVVAYKKAGDAHADIAKTDKVPISSPIAVWDALLLVAGAAKQANSIEAKAIAGALEQLNDEAATNPLFTLYKEYRYSPEHHVVVSAKAEDYPVIDPGPVSAGHIQAPAS